MPLTSSSSTWHEDDTLDYLGHSGGQGRGDGVGVWQRLHRSGASTSAIGLGWRVLYAVLPVRSMVAFYRNLPLGEGKCEASGCGCQETLSHAFMECDKVRGAIDWLLDLYEAISGRRPPRDPRVLLADDHRVWGSGGSEEERLLWQRLRLIVLYHFFFFFLTRKYLQGTRI